MTLLDIAVRDKRFGERAVLHGVALQIEQGEFVSLVGASGCGKSTLLRLVAGLDTQYTGRIAFDGRPVRGPTRDIRFVFQEPRLFPWLDVRRNVAFDLVGDGRGDDEGDRRRVDALLDEVGLAGLGDRLPKQLSGGQAQRVALARGLCVQPRVLLLDEPFSAVDAFTRRHLQDLLLRVTRAHGITVLLVTHDVEEAVLLSDRVVVLDAEPARVARVVPVTLPRPRYQDHPESIASSAAVRRVLRDMHAVPAA